MAEKCFELWTRLGIIDYGLPALLILACEKEACEKEACEIGDLFPFPRREGFAKFGDFKSWRRRFKTAQEPWGSVLGDMKA